jgi:hypothetical protein
VTAANTNAPPRTPTLLQLLQLSVLVEQMLGREAAIRVFRLLREMRDAR